jgi:uncharacterized membrane protein
MNHFLQIFLLAMAPIGELRLAIPIGIAVYKLDTAMVFLTAVAGNLVPVFLILFLFKKISDFFTTKSKIYSALFSWWGTNALERHSVKIQQYGLIGLLLFVGIPLPFTGAYTGALLAVLMNFPLMKSVPAISGGIITSGILVTLLVVFGVNMEEYIGWQMILGLLLLVSLVWWYFKNRKKRKLRKMAVKADLNQN